ncbi:MAG TPA: hypothetical protein VLE96_04480 [Chlamydiales bacterium]|nr:hypothetical protein [Chlamydiales bacterium]
MKISGISPADLLLREKEKSSQERSKVKDVVRDCLEIKGGEAALFAQVLPISKKAFGTIRKKRKKNLESEQSNSRFSADKA